MFIQVIQGKVSDEAGLRRCMDRWTEDVRPGATGFLGCTQGLCDDGTFIALARFESAEAARRNSERPEQARGGQRPRGASRVPCRSWTART